MNEKITASHAGPAAMQPTWQERSSVRSERRNSLRGNFSLLFTACGSSQLLASSTAPCPSQHFTPRYRDHSEVAVNGCGGGIGLTDEGGGDTCSSYSSAAKVDEAGNGEAGECGG